MPVLNLLFSLLLLSTISLSCLQAQISGVTLIEQIKEQQTTVNSEFARLSMQIVNSRGQSRYRELEIYQSTDGEDLKTVIKFTLPDNVKGIGLLNLKKGDQQTQKLYLPALKRFQTIVNFKRQERFIGSDFSFEDLEPFDYSRFDTILMDSTADHYTLKITPDFSSSYTPLFLTVQKEHLLLLKTEFFTNEEKVKTLKAEDWSLYEGVYLPDKLTMFSHKKETYTVLSWIERNINKKIDKSVFTEDFLRQ